MSKIQEIIEKREAQTDQGTPPNDYQRHLDNLRALDVLVDKLTEIAKEINRTRRS